MEEERASEIYRHDEKEVESANLDISPEEVDRRYWQSQARVDVSGPLGTARYLGDGEREKERERVSRREHGSKKRAAFQSARRVQ